jgi:excisionase family DNA binding protein
MNNNPFEILERNLERRLESIESRILELSNKPIPETKQPEKYLTMDQVAEMLSVSRVTLWNWDKKGILESQRFGNLRRYKLSDIEKMMNER